MKRGPQDLIQRLAPSKPKKMRQVEPAGPLQADELLAIWLPRKYLEVRHHLISVVRCADAFG